MINPRVTNVAVPALNGGFVAIVLANPGATSRAEVEEDLNYNEGAPQGLVGYYVDPAIANAAWMAAHAADNAAQLLAALEAAGAIYPAGQQTWGAPGAPEGQAYQPIKLGDWLRIHAGYGPMLGKPGDCVLLLTSATANATGILLTEWI